MYALIGVYVLGLVCLVSIIINIALLKINKVTELREQIYFEELTWIIKHLYMHGQGDVSLKLCSHFIKSILLL